MKKINDYKLFQELLSLSQNQLRAFMVEFLRKKYSKTIVREQFLMACGNIPITLVAHLDTVFKDGKRLLCYDEKHQIMWSPQGAGFDDRAGVAAIIKLVEAGFRPNIILCCDEESGGKGALALTQEFAHLPFKNNFFIELDRAGHDDAVFYYCENPEFTRYIEQFGFIEQYGTFSDISILAPHFGAAAVNLSIGYEAEHSHSEYLELQWFYATLFKVENILKEETIPAFEYIESTSALFNLWGYDEDICDHCGEPHKEIDLFAVVGLDEKIKLFCPDCVVKNVKWCTKCGAGFEVALGDSAKSFVCKGCKEKEKKNNGSKRK